MHRALVTAAAVVVLGLGTVLAACGSDGGSAAPAAPLSAAGQNGRQVAKEQGCISCHTADGEKGTGPTWQGLAGSTVTLEDGTEVTADDAYLRDAIVRSRGQVVEGYPNIMPVYEGELSEAELDDLIAYLHDLAPADAGSKEPDGEGAGGS
ncbi:MAG: cytochrome subunit [Ilumatobacteraceae bacterium]|nr:cytochrome subunit [Ilumatobacteraceae bacterium]